MPGAVVISAAVEGIVDESVIRRLVTYVGAIPGSICGKTGKQDIRLRIQGYNSAAQRTPWIVLVDLDNDAHCAPPLRAAWLPNPAPQMCFRVAVRQVEAWLLADRERIASYLAVRRDMIPGDPESLANAKDTLVNLARKSRRREIREDMVPRIGSGRSVGPAYSSRVIEFASRHWRPDVARLYAESLSRAVECLRSLTISRRC
ncbi:MAG: hypothetical protein RDU20_00855 [Desulfomonilaceae bacterium]|nr:hypothetical protein [Desulfomonilaceae bacterium]